MGHINVNLRIFAGTCAPTAEYLSELWCTDLSPLHKVAANGAHAVSARTTLAFLLVRMLHISNGTGAPRRSFNLVTLRLSGHARILAEGAIELSVTLSGGALFAS